jgi:endonuclease III
VKQETEWVEPRLFLSLEQRFEIPSSLFGMGGERPIVHGQPRRLVTTGLKRSGDNCAGTLLVSTPDSSGERERDSHLDELPVEQEALSHGDVVVNGGGAGRPEEDPAPSLPTDLIQEGTEQLLCDRYLGIPMIGVNRHLDTPTAVSLAEMAVAHQPARVDNSGHGPCASPPAVLRMGCLEALLFAQRSEPVGSGYLPKQLGDLSCIGRGQVVVDLDRDSTHGDDPTGSVRSMARPRSAAGRARVTSERLAHEFPGTAKELCALEYDSPFQLLTATILSAQCTDRRVNLVTQTLFARYPNAAALAVADPDAVEEIIRSIGFFRAKTRNIIGMANALVDRFDGEVPTQREELVTLPGVGRKTANVVRSVAFGLPGLPVDTHVGRLSVRLGLTTETDPVKVELALNALVPAGERGAFSLRLILHGRQTCTARSPRCTTCVLADFCPSATVPAVTRKSRVS